MKRYYDRIHERNALKLLPGDYAVAVGDEILVTVLGSCVSACIRDRRTGIGGMNHFMLPLPSTDAAFADGARYGVHAMELLLNDLFKAGARREDLEAKVFGGGAVLDMPTLDIGRQNGIFVRQFLRTERIPISAEDLFGQLARKIYFEPQTGHVRVKYLRDLRNRTVVQRESAYAALLAARTESAVELFS